MKKENKVVIKNTFYHLAPGGKGWHAVPGEGVLNKELFVGTPSSPLWGTSPASGEVNGGFTLIELLVVVLIIGILAAVAVPQYQMAVKKSRLMKALPTLAAISRAKTIYYMANGKYTDNLDELDIDIPYTTFNGTSYKIPSLGGSIQLSSTGPMARWTSPYGFSLEVYREKVYCFHDERLCSSLGKYYYTTQEGDNVYELKLQ